MPRSLGSSPWDCRSSESGTEPRQGRSFAIAHAFVRTFVSGEEQLDDDLEDAVDNLSTDKTPAVHKWLVRHRRFHFHFTPSYGSWMNLVERWFAALTTKKLTHAAHRSVKELTADITAWVETWNDHPTPFVWHKTAEEILDHLASYCAAINQNATP
ncbi:MAG TPA: transposase [Acidimicrobiales bacterium]|nr:transposase [Acidimicrobiales bacterium]